MNNIFTFIKKNGDLSFEEYPITEVDILIFSQITYINFKGIVLENNTGITLHEAWINSKDKNKISKALAQKNAVKLISKMYNTKRYKDIILKNYQYELTDKHQFGAITMDIPGKFIYVCFEGTDDNMVGWKEDCEFAYIYPTGAQELARDYLNNAIKNTNKKVIVCGHSKGGNLALTGSMQVNFLKKLRIKKIYSFDGPGLKMKEFNSINYKLVRKKLVNIIPNGSFIGILLEQENMRVIKSVGIGFFQHEPTTWIVEGDSFKPSTQDKHSKRLDKSFNKWLEKFDYKEREELINSIFTLFDNADIDSLYDIKINLIQSYYNLVKSSKKLDDTTKEVLKDSFRLFIEEFGNNLLNDGKEFIKETVDNIKNIGNKRD